LVISSRNKMLYEAQTAKPNQNIASYFLSSHASYLQFREQKNVYG